MEIRIGQVTHYYNHLGVAVLDLCGELNLGDTVHFLGHTSDFEQKVSSLEINHHKVMRACPGMGVALQVWEPVRKGDAVYVQVEAHTMGVEALGL